MNERLRHARDGQNPVSHLIQIQTATLPWLLDQLAGAEDSKAVQAAICRLEQMNELFEFFVSIVEINPRCAAHLLDLRKMPQPADRKDQRSLRCFYKVKSAALTLTNLLEELSLYCQSNWIRSNHPRRAHVRRINELWNYFLPSTRMETMLYRLPRVLRDEVAFLS